MKTLLVDTFNGEGYSEPTIEVVAERNNVDFMHSIEDMRSSYSPDFLEKQIDGDKKGDVILTYDNDEDQGSIHIMDIPTPEFYIVQVKPQINEVSFYVKMPTIETALSTLQDIVNNEELCFDEDDIEEYDGEDFFGSHGKEEFLYFKIVQG